MTIDPIQSSGPSPTEKAPSRPHTPHGSGAVRSSDHEEHEFADAGRAGGDRIELSDAAKRLTEEASTAERPSGTVPPDKLALVSKRLLEGFYDTEAVRQAIAEALLEDLE